VSRRGPTPATRTSLDNGNPLAVNRLINKCPTGNFVDEALVIAAVTVDVNGNESPDGGCAIARDWVFGAEGLSKVRRPCLPDAGHALVWNATPRAASLFEPPRHCAAM